MIACCLFLLSVFRLFISLREQLLFFSRVYNMQFALKVYEQLMNGNLSVCAIMKKIRFSGAPEGT